MCRSAGHSQSKRRCPSQSDPLKRSKYNAVRRERYQQRKEASASVSSSGVSTPFAVNEDELFSEENIDRYSGGECYRLAHETYRLAKEKYPTWKFVAIVPDVEGFDDEWAHMSVLTDNNEFLDIDGLNKSDKIEYMNNDFLQERWGWYVKEHYQRKTGVKTYDMKAKLVTIKDEDHYQDLIGGQSEGATTDEDAAETARHLFAWYEQQNSN